MKVVIFTCMTCMFAAALTMGVPIRRHASQSEKTVPIGGNVTLICPLRPDDLWKWVYWKKNGLTIYSLEVQSNTPRTNDTRYEGSNHATRLTIKNLEKTDSGIYHCQVATLVFIKERGHVLLFVTDQEVGLSTASPGVPFRASTMIPPQPSGYNTIFLKSIFIISIIVSIVISVVTLYLVYFNRDRERNLPVGCVSAFRRLAHKSSPTSLGPDSSHHEIGDEAPRSSSTPLGPDFSHHDTRDEEGTCTYLLSSDTHGRDDVDVDDRLEESYC